MSHVIPPSSQQNRRHGLRADRAAIAGVYRLRTVVVTLVVGVVMILLVGSSIATAGPKSARVSRSTVQLARLRIGNPAPPRPSALRAWAQEVRLRTSIHIAHEPVSVRASGAGLLRYPLLILAGDRAIGRVSTTAVARLREHLTAGGLLLIDDMGRSGPSAAFDRDVHRLMKRVLGKRLQTIAATDVIYRTFYRLRRPVGRRASAPTMEGVKISNRWAVIYSHNDLIGSFQRSAGGGAALPVLPGGERQRELAWRLGINLVMYAVSSDYKDDHTHVGQLLRRRRGR